LLEIVAPPSVLIALASLEQRPPFAVESDLPRWPIDSELDAISERLLDIEHHRIALDECGLVVDRVHAGVLTIATEDDQPPRACRWFPNS
jgi:hypothetical protein